jgi:16S rRNA (guanine966-N2)-methyltransferase
MRIVAGMWRGRRLAALKGQETRPTSDRVREALFSAIQSRYPYALNGPVLDAFAGTGALALEALSRGASRATAIERDPAALAVLRENVETLGADSCRVVRGDVIELARDGRVPGGPFALLLLDAPYRIERAQVRAVLEALAASQDIAPGAVVAWEHAARDEPDWPDAFRQSTRRTYGNTALALAVFDRGD